MFAQQDSFCHNCHQMWISIDVIWIQWCSILSWILKIQLLTPRMHVSKKTRDYMCAVISTFVLMLMNQLVAFQNVYHLSVIGWISKVPAELKSKYWGSLFKIHINSCGSFLIKLTYNGKSSCTCVDICPTKNAVNACNHGVSFLTVWYWYKPVLLCIFAWGSFI